MCCNFLPTSTGASVMFQSIEEIVESIGQYDIRMALIEFKDHPPEDREFVTRSHDFTRNISTMVSWLDAAEATGGGDEPEAVTDALRAALRDLNWREDCSKICVLITDFRPHGLWPQYDNFKNGG